MFKWCWLVCVQVFWRTDNALLLPCLLRSNSTLFIIWWNKLTQPFCKHLGFKKNRLKTEMPGEVTDWSSPLFVHLRGTTTAAELNRQSGLERGLFLTAVPQWCCSPWKRLTYGILILISLLLRRDSEVSELGETFCFFTLFRTSPMLF